MYYYRRLVTYYSTVLSYGQGYEFSQEISGFIPSPGSSTITASQAGDGNYNAASDITYSITVNPKTLTITAEDAVKTEGDLNPTFTFTYSGFAYSENSSVLNCSPILTSTATTGSTGGIYPITVSDCGFNNSNYTYTFVAGSLTVLFTNAEINVKQGETNILSGGNYSFGNVAQGASSETITFTIENVGASTLSLIGSPDVISISGTHAADFIIDQTLTSTNLNGNTSTTFTITFTPGTLAMRNAEVTILSDDSDEGTYTFSISGTGILPTSVIGNVSNDPKILVYPSPSYGSFTVNTEDKIIKVRVTDIVGHSEEYDSGTIHTSLKGVLSIEVTTDKTIFRTKILSVY